MSKQDLIYCRQSTEPDERTGLSNEEQVRAMMLYASEGGPCHCQVVQESGSARVPGRPVFADFMRKILREEVRIIYCTSLDRLAQNRTDGAALVWALINGMILEIATQTHNYCNNLTSVAIILSAFDITEEDINAFNPSQYS